MSQGLSWELGWFFLAGDVGPMKGNETVRPMREREWGFCNGLINRFVCSLRRRFRRGTKFDLSTYEVSMTNSCELAESQSGR